MNDPLKHHKPIRNAASTFSILSAGLLGLTLLTACGDDKTSKDVRQNLSNTAESISDFAEQRFDEARGWFSSRFDDAGDELQKLRDKASSLQGDARAKADESLNKLSEQWDALKAKLADLKDDGSDAWRDAAKGLRDGWDEFSDSLDKARKDLES